MAFLPDGRMLITERPGRLRVFANGKLERTPLAGVPQVHTGGQAGLLDVCLHPRFAQNRVLYLSYMSPGAGGPTATVARAELGDGGLRGTTVIFEALPRAAGQCQPRLAHRLRPRRVDVCELRRPLPDAAGAGPARLRRQDRAAQGRRLDAAGQSVRRPAERAARDLHLGPSQSAGPGAASRDRPDLGGRARAQGRRRAQHPEGRRQLRLAAA